MDTERVLHEATKFFERDENDPITTFAIDDYLTTVSISLPALILAVAIFLGGDMYSVEGLQVFLSFSSLNRFKIRSSIRIVFSVPHRHTKAIILRLGIRSRS
jgi:hypothetical protein